MDFGKNLPCKYISCNFEWADLLEIKVIRELKGAMGLDSLESHQSKQPFGLDFFQVQTIPCHISTEILQLIVRLSREGHRQVDIALITGATQGAISEI